MATFSELLVIASANFVGVTLALIYFHRAEAGILAESEAAKYRNFDRQRAVVEEKLLNIQKMTDACTKSTSLGACARTPTYLTV